MKLLWLLVSITSAYFAYHIYTHTSIRHKDLEAVMMQNLAIEKGVKFTKLNTKKDYLRSADLVEKQGRSAKDVAILQKATNIRTKTETVLQHVNSLTSIPENLKIDSKVGLKNEKLALIQEYAINFPQFVAKQDTVLKDFEEPIFLLLDTKTHFTPFLMQSNLGLQYRISRIEWRGVDKMTSQIGCCCWFWDRILGMGTAKSQAVEVGKIYQATMLLTTNTTRIRPEMQISEGTIKVYGDVSEIEIKNVKAQNYNSEGKATKTLTGKITIMKADGSDTTFTLSTNYTVKKKL